MAKSKFFKKNQTLTKNPQSNGPSYTQALNNVKDIVKIKDIFPKLSADKISEVYQVISNLNQKNKPRLNMIIKGLLRKQIIVSIGSNNSKKVIIKANAYVSNINKILKRMKSKIFINFIWSNNKRLLITTNKVATASNLNIIEKYVKDLNDVDSNIMSPRLSQSKLYLKILGITYFIKDTSLPLLSDIIERVIKSTHIFNSIVLTLHSYIIKASSKSDIVVI